MESLSECDLLNLAHDNKTNKLQYLCTVVIQSLELNEHKQCRPSTAARKVED